MREIRIDLNKLYINLNPAFAMQDLTTCGVMVEGLHLSSVTMFSGIESILSFGIGKLIVGGNLWKRECLKKGICRVRVSSRGASMVRESYNCILDPRDSSLVWNKDSSI